MTRVMCDYQFRLPPACVAQLRELPSLVDLDQRQRPIEFRLLGLDPPPHGARHDYGRSWICRGKLQVFLCARGDVPSPATAGARRLGVVEHWPGRVDDEVERRVCGIDED
jgi:hypothetical protein